MRFQHVDEQSAMTMAVKRRSEAARDALPVPAPLGSRPAGSLVVMAPNAWHTAWRNRQHLLSRLAQRGWDIAYSRGPFRSWNVGTADWQAAPWLGHWQMRDRVAVWQRGRLVLQPGWRHKARWLPLALHARRLKRRLRDPSGHIFCIYHPQYEPFVAALKSGHVAYYLYDDFAAELGHDRELLAAHERLIRRTDLLVATSEGIAERLLGPAAPRAQILPNGADCTLIETLAARAAPDFLHGIPRPRILYSGAVNQKVDLDRIASLARHRPDWHWLLIGPQILPREIEPARQPFAVALAALRSLGNVHLVGERPFPDYLTALHHADVAVICNRQDEGWWQNAYPLKFHEYLAAGRPVVATPIRSIQEFAPVARFAASDEDWLAALNEAIEAGGHGSPDTRRAAARTHDWNRLADRFEDMLLALRPPTGSGYA
ncbi:MAG: glycosyltransferase family 1 protein [Alphaproteobacteria bacterium]|nr:glycosyltransferase family 1 protein [Alphaproteobacteria bacterium]